MDAARPPELPALFPEPAPVPRPDGGLEVFRRRSRHSRPAEARPDPAVWAAAHPGARGRAPSGTVHEVNDRWLPACGAGLNSWDFRGLQATDNQITCGRCRDSRARREPVAGQLELFPLGLPVRGP